RRVRMMEGPLSSLPIIGLIAEDSPAERRRAAEAGMNGVVVKPIVQEQLFDAIGEFIETPAADPAKDDGCERQQQTS
ncbi:MAG: hypothetical protein MI861_06540, partial [Pirellulales bacterium]|nr:hypothetical protein [Pirellulales bacterium]